ncbi:hypothetical protein [Mesorhizobium sp. M0768]|uniref:hypothetical protein n=1 Tax=unclassified Mesorhizobium TaxID=325217 RepID=UPI00333A3C52
MRRWIKGLVFAAAGAAIVYAVFFGPLPFVRSWWQDDNWLDPLHKRHRIADSLVLTGWLVGKSRAEVLAALGAPPETDKFSDWSLVYVLGPERGLLSIDYEWLAIRTDDAGSVTEAAVIRD